MILVQKAFLSFIFEKKLHISYCDITTLYLDMINNLLDFTVVLSTGLPEEIAYTNMVTVSRYPLQ